MAQTFGRYELLELLGRGGMGEVYLARDQVRERTVALKVLPAHLASDALYLARFRRESRLAAQLSDPHIIPIHDFGEIDGRLFIDMRLVSGSDLATILHDRGPLPPAVAVDVVAQVASALDAAHADGLVHRDVKPSNVMLTGLSDDLVRRPPFAYLVDFGIARSTAQLTALTDTSAGALGTLAYMSPERISGDVGDARGDVYALACVLYEALTAQPPFEGDVVPLMYQHLNAEPPRPSSVRAGIPSALDDVVRIGMAKAVTQRYVSAGDLAFAAREALLDRPARDTEPPAGGSGRPAPSADPAVPRPRRPRPDSVVPAVGPRSPAGGAAPPDRSAPDVAPTRMGGATWSRPADARPRRVVRTSSGEQVPDGVVTLVVAAFDAATGGPESGGPDSGGPDSGGPATGRGALESLWPAHGGVVVLDAASPVIAFADPVAALAAAADAVRTLGPGPVRVRLAVHTGEPVLHGTGYWGPDLDYAHRLAGAAQAGQTLVSDASAQRVPGAPLELLGRRALDGFPTALPIHHLTVDGATAARFPRPRVVPASRAAIPRPPALPAHAEPAAAEITRRISRGQRAVSIAGQDGAGTTTLALEVGRRLATRFESTIFLALDGVPGDCLAAMLAFAAGVPELAGTSTAQRLATALRDRRVLLVLDDAEGTCAQGEARAVLDGLLAGAPGVHLLGTGRAALGLQGEQVVDAVAPAAFDAAGEQWWERLEAGERALLAGLCGAPAGLGYHVARHAFGDAVDALPSLVAAGFVRSAADGRALVRPPVRRTVVALDPGAVQAGRRAIGAALADLAGVVEQRWLVHAGEMWPRFAPEVPAVLTALAQARAGDPALHAELSVATAWLLAAAGLTSTARDHLELARRGAGDVVLRARCAQAGVVLDADLQGALDTAELWHDLARPDAEVMCLARAADAQRQRGELGAAGTTLERARPLAAATSEPDAVARLLDLVLAEALAAGDDPAAAGGPAWSALQGVRPGTPLAARAATVCGDVARRGGEPADALGLYGLAMLALEPFDAAASGLEAAERIATALLDLERADDAEYVVAICEAVHAELALPAPPALHAVRQRLDGVAGAGRMLAARARASSYSAAEGLTWIGRLARGEVVDVRATR